MNQKIAGLTEDTENLSEKPQELSDDDLEIVTGGCDAIDKELEDRIISIVKECFDLNNISVTCESEMAADLGAGSLDMVDLVQVLEEEFKVSFNDASLASLVTIGDIATYISCKIQ